MAHKEEFYCDRYGNSIPPEENMPNQKIINYTPVPKQDIKVTMKQVIKLAKDENKPVRLKLSGIELIVKPDYEDHLEELFFAGMYYHKNINKSLLPNLFRKQHARTG